MARLELRRDPSNAQDLLFYVRCSKGTYVRRVPTGWSMGKGPLASGARQPPHPLAAVLPLINSLVSRRGACRTLAADLGASLGTCAHLRSLRREAIGPFRVEDAWTLEVRAPAWNRHLPRWNRWRRARTGVDQEWGTLPSFHPLGLHRAPSLRPSRDSGGAIQA